MILFLFISLILNLNSQNFADSKVNITVDKNSYRTNTYLTYSFRFSSFNDVLGFYLIPSDFYYRVSNISLRDSVRLKYYGYSTYPFRYFIGEKKKVEFADNTEHNEQSMNNKEREVKKNYLKLSLNPLFDDIKENINWYFFDLTMKSFSEDWTKLDTKAKKEFLGDLSAINIPFLSNISPKTSTEIKKR